MISARPSLDRDLDLQLRAHRRRVEVKDLRPRGAGWAVRLHEKGGEEHHALAEALRAYIDAAGIGDDRKGFCFALARGTAPRC